jgi:DNA-binding transcriptional regulator YiaG
MKMSKARIRAIRGKYTRLEWSTLLGISAQSIYYWEHGLRTPRGSTVLLLRLLERDRGGKLLKEIEAIQYRK